MAGARRRAPGKRRRRALSECGPDLRARAARRAVSGRFAVLPELRDIVQAHLGRLTCEQGIALLEKAEIPVSRVRGLSEALHDEHFRVRGTLRPMRRSASTAPAEG